MDPPSQMLSATRVFSYCNHTQGSAAKQLINLVSFVPTSHQRTPKIVRTPSTTQSSSTQLPESATSPHLVLEPLDVGPADPERPGRGRPHVRRLEEIVNLRRKMVDAIGTMAITNCHERIRHTGVPKMSSPHCLAYTHQAKVFQEKWFNFEPEFFVCILECVLGVLLPVVPFMGGRLG